MHKLAAYKFGNKTYRTKRYRVEIILSQNSTHMLFLTATPHKGDQENFRLLLDLLVPGLFTDKEVLLEVIKNNENPIFLRRMKEDLIDFDSKKIFKPRISKTISFNLTNDEMEIYNELSKYIRDRYTMLQGNKRNIVFPLIILQRRFASSLYALLKSLKRRKSKLQEFLKNGKFEEYTQITIDDLLELEDEEEKERWERELEMETIPISIKRE